MSGGAALAAAELAAAVVPRTPSFLDAVAEVVVLVAPRPFVQFGIDTFGTSDKTALMVGTLVLTLLAAMASGLRARQSRWHFPATLVAFTLVGGACALRPSGASPLGVLVVAVTAFSVGLAVSRALLEGPPTAPVGSLAGRPAPVHRSRREFMVLAGGAAATSTMLGAAARVLARPGRAAAARQSVTLPPPVATPAVTPAGTAFDVPGLSPIITPNRSFYRIDTALVVPDVDPDDWALEIKGLVDRPTRYTYRELLDRATSEADVTIACVSNPVGGDLVGTARWQGVPLRDLLAEAGVRKGADQIVGRSVDGFTAGFPLAALADGDRTALVAVGMNGEPLPIRSGFPARLIVAGLYGYVSATKWLSSIELTTFEEFDAYWIVRGWSALGPVKTATRIDVPAKGAKVPVGDAVVAGVAWAPTRGIDRVEVRIDEGPWQEAELSTPLHDETWRQWRLAWRATKGTHRIEARATDGTGAVQTEKRTDSFPDGATGYHRITVKVRA